MVEKEIIIESDSGVHARPASMLVKLAMNFESDVFFVKDDVEINAKSIMMLLSMGLTKGTKLILRVDGPDEEEAFAQLVELINSDFK